MGILGRHVSSKARISGSVISARLSMDLECVQAYPLGLLVEEIGAGNDVEDNIVEQRTGFVLGNRRSNRNSGNSGNSGKRVGHLGGGL